MAQGLAMMRVKEWQRLSFLITEIICIDIRVARILILMAQIWKRMTEE